MIETILFIWELVMYALIAIAVIFVAAVGIVCVWRPQAWNETVFFPWAKAERRAAKKKAKAELRAWREFYADK